jgi:uncharacterized protein YkwD
VKLTRAAGFTAAFATVGCTAVPPDPAAGALRVRAPHLEHPVTETYPSASRPEDPVKLAVWERVNIDRAAAGRLPVAWDEAASRVADTFCAEQIHEGTSGHYLTDGMPPYTRTALAGIFGMQAENVVSWKSSGPRFDASTLSLALSGHAGMMSELPPSDGHRRTILDPDATHVGVGYAQEHGNFRMAQEFLTRRLAELALLRVAEDPDRVLANGRARAPYRVEFVTLAHEASPRHLTRAEATARDTYTYPIPALAYVPEGVKSLRVVGAETQDRLRVGPAGDFSFRFTPGRPGLWTIVLYMASGRGKPSPGGMFVLWIEKAAS